MGSGSESSVIDWEVALRAGLWLCDEEGKTNAVGLVADRRIMGLNGGRASKELPEDIGEEDMSASSDPVNSSELADVVRE